MELTKRQKAEHNYKYITLKHGTKYGNPKLLDNSGYSYDIRSVKGESVRWQCISRKGKSCCSAFVIQTGKKFKLNGKHVSHLTRLENFEIQKKKFLASGKSFHLDVKYLAKIALGYKKRWRHLKGKENDSTKSESGKILKTRQVNKTLEATDLNKNITNPFQVFYDGEMKKMLIDQKDFFSYNVHKSTGKIIVWKCVQCLSIIRQSDQYITPPNPKHSHSITKGEQELAMQILKMAQSFKRCLSPINDQKVVMEKCLTTNFNHKDKNDVDKLHSLEDLQEVATKVLTVIHNAGIFVNNSQYLIKTIKYYLNKNNTKCLNVKDVTNGWLKNFIDSNRTLFPVPASASPKDSILHFIKTLESSLYATHQLKAQKYLTENNAKQIYACDTIECVINTSKVGPKTDLSTRGQRNMMVMCSTSLAGHSIKPLIIHRSDRGHSKSKKLKYDSHKNVDGKYNRIDSPEGNVTSEVFHSWLVNFDNELVEKEIPRPVIAFVSGCHEQVAFESIELSNNRNIFLFCLPKKASHLLNPMSRTVFPELKKKYMVNFTDSLQNNTRAMPRRMFPIVFLKSYAETRVSDLITEGFKSTGLCPYNPSLVINELPNKLKPNNDSAPISGKRSRHEESSPVKQSKKVKREKSDSSGTNLNSSSSSTKKRKSSSDNDESLSMATNSMTSDNILNDNGTENLNVTSAGSVLQDNEIPMTPGTPNIDSSSLLSSSQSEISNCTSDSHAVEETSKAKEKPDINELSDCSTSQKTNISEDQIDASKKVCKTETGISNKCVDDGIINSYSFENSTDSANSNAIANLKNCKVRCVDISETKTHSNSSPESSNDEDIKCNELKPKISATQEGYNLALLHFDQIVKNIIDPQVLDLFHKKYETSSSYPDSSFLVWRGLQELKELSTVFTTNS